MNHIIANISLLFITTSISFAQNGMDAYPSGARSRGLAQSHVTLDDGWSVFNNVGAMGRLLVPQAVFGYDHRLGINELTTLAAGAILTMDIGVLGFGVSSYGGELFKQNCVGVGLSNKLGIASFGIKINYMQTNIEGHGRLANPVIEFGGVAELGPKILFGAHLYNITRAKFGRNSDDYLPTLIKAGVSVRSFEKLLINGEVEKEILLPPKLKMGLEYNILDRCWARTGFQTAPGNLYFGIGFKPRRFNIDYALSQNYRLGYTHHFSFNYVLGKD